MKDCTTAPIDNPVGNSTTDVPRRVGESWLS